MGIQLKSTAQTSAETFKKLCIHGQSGIGKSMLSATAYPFKPLIILTEKTGDESLTPENIIEVFGADQSDILYEMDIIQAFEPDEFSEAVQYAIESTDHDLIIFDSMSKVSRLILKHAKTEHAHGMKAYGQHNDKAMELIEELLDGDKHVVMLSHTERQVDDDSGETIYYPAFEGAKFSQKFVYDMPHVLFMEDVLDDDGNTYKALRAKKGDSNKRVKTRGNALDELNRPHLGELLQKLIHGKGEASPKKKAKK